MTTTGDKIKAGVALLNENLDDDWRTLIDPSRLDMSNGCGCILGQIYGSFDEGIFALGLNVFEAPEYGFDLPDWDYDEYERLGNRWLEELGQPVDLHSA